MDYQESKELTDTIMLYTQNGTEWITAKHHIAKN